MSQTNQPCCKTIGVSGDGSCSRLAELVHCRNCAEYARAGRELFDQPLPQSDLDQWTKLLALPKELEPEGAVSGLVFRVRTEWFAIKSDFLQEIAELRSIHTVPFRTGPSFKGVANINGELLLCIDPARVLGLDPRDPAPRRMIVAAKEHQRFALVVEEILGVRRIAAASVVRTPATVSKIPSALTSGLFMLEHKSVGLLDEQLFFEALAGSMVP